MATNAFDLFATLKLDSTEYEKGLDDAEKSGSNFGKGLSTAFGVGAAAITAVATAAVATGKAIVDTTSATAQYGDNIDKMSQKMGLTAEAYQEWDAVMQHSGTSMESMKASMKTLANAVETGNEAFEALGLTQEKLATMSQQDIFEATIAGLQNVKDTTERTYLAGKLLGRGATELGALLNTSAKDTQAMRDRVHELGGVMSNDAVKASAAFQDQLQDMQTAFSGLSRGLSSEFLPSITGVMSGLTEIFSGNYDKGVEQISQSINTIVTTLTDMLPEIAEIGLGIIESLATAIIDNLPQIVDVAIGIIMKLIDGLVAALPALAENAVQIIGSIAKGIAEALPDLIPAIVDVVLTIVDTLLDNIDLLVEAAIELIIGLTEGLIAALPILIEKAPELIIKFVEALIRNAPLLLEVGIELILALVNGIVNCFGKLIEVGSKLVEQVKGGFSQKVQDAKNWGRDMIQNFINGILAKWNALKQSVSNVAQSVKNLLGFSEPKEGPLSNFHTYAPDMMKLFAKGIEDNSDLVTNALTDVGDSMMSGGFNTGAILDASVTGSASAESGNNIAAMLKEYLPGLTGGTNVNVTLEGDAQGVFKLVRTEASKFTKSTGYGAFA